jgi:CO/xanthine dehydrogenase FAD-binding subunit
MITEYFRPKNIREAVDLLNTKDLAIPIGGGTSMQNLVEDIVVVDLQDLDMNYIKTEVKNTLIGSTATLEQMKEHFRGNETIKKVMKIEGSKNQRTQGSLGGFLNIAGGRSPLLTCLLTLNCTVFFAEEEKGISLIEFLDVRKNNKKLITHLSVKEPENLVFESVSRSPLDVPIICCAVNKYGNEISAAVGGFGERPQIVPEKYLREKSEIEIKQYLHFSTDEWASDNYRANITQIVLKRLIGQTKKGKQ